MARLSSARALTSVPRPRSAPVDEILVAPEATREVATAGFVEAPARAVTHHPRGLPARSVQPFLGVPRAGWSELAWGASAGVFVLAAGAIAGAGLPVVLSIAFVTVWIAALMATGHHRAHPVPDTWAEAARRLCRAGAVAAVVWWAAPTALSTVGTAGPLQPFDSHLVVHTAAVVLLTLAARTVLRAVRGVHRPRLVVAGHPEDVLRAVAEMRGAGHRPIAVCLSRPRPGSTEFAELDIPVTHGLQQAEHALRTHHGEALLVLPGGDVDPTSVRRLQWQAAQAGAEVYVASGLLDVAPTRTQAVSAAGMRALHVTHPRLRGPAQWIKSAADRVLAGIALLFLGPVLIGVALHVRKDSPGPALFRQTRVGRDGHTFTMLKFRSMHVAAAERDDTLHALDESDGVLFKIRRDPRVTRAGSWMRRYSVDELPQLINVLRGEMSLVGPRPALPSEVAAYDHDPHRRLAVRPGLTGLWQVSGRSDLSWAETVRLDVRYVDNWSLRLDMWILLRTVRAVLSHRGAY